MDDTYFLKVTTSCCVHDSGTYTVTVSNAAGKVERSAEVKVNKPQQEEPAAVEEEVLVMEEAAVACDAPPKPKEPEVKPEPVKEAEIPEEESSEESEEEVVIPKPQFQFAPKSVKVEEGDLIKLVFKLVEGISCETHLIQRLDLLIST